MVLIRTWFFTRSRAAWATVRRSSVQRLVRSSLPEEMRETVANVCTLLDIGRSVDYFDRHRNAAMIVAAADLYGFSQRAIALLFAVLMQAGNAANRLKTLQMGGEREQALDRIDLQVGNEGGFRRIARGHQERIKAALAGEGRHRQDAIRVAHRTVQGEFPDDKRAGEVPLDLFGGEEQSDGNG